MYLSSSLSLSLSLSSSFFGQIMSHHHSDHMSQWSQVSEIAPWMCSLNIFVFLIVFVFVFGFFIVFNLLFCPVMWKRHYLTNQNTTQIRIRSKNNPCENYAKTIEANNLGNYSDLTIKDDMVQPSKFLLCCFIFAVLIFVPADYIDAGNFLVWFEMN